MVDQCTFAKCKRKLLKKTNLTPEESRHINKAHQDVIVKVWVTRDSTHFGIRRNPERGMRYQCVCGRAFLYTSSVQTHWKTCEVVRRMPSSNSHSSGYIQIISNTQDTAEENEEPLEESDSDGEDEDETTSVTSVSATQSTLATQSGTLNQISQESQMFSSDIIATPWPSATSTQISSVVFTHQVLLEDQKAQLQNLIGQVALLKDRMDRALAKPSSANAGRKK